MTGRGRTIFELSGVCFAYKEKEVLKNISFAITEGGKPGNSGGIGE
jgi:ABC-type molybdenum transport system ATPase subunit/photorepair protein PhrA